MIATRGPRCGLAPGGGPPTRTAGRVGQVGGCGGVVLECSDLLALCVAPRDCGDRPAACPKQRDMIPKNATQLPLATAPDWDGHVRCPCGASLLSLIQRHGFNRANKAYACGSRPRRAWARFSVESMWTCDRTTALLRNPHRQNKRPYPHRLLVSIPKDFLKPPNMSTIRKLVATSTFSTHRYSQATFLKFALPNQKACARNTLETRETKTRL